MLEETDILEAGPGAEAPEAPGSEATPCERPHSPIYEWRKRAKRARTLRGAITVASVVIAVGGVVAGIIGGAVAAASNVRKKKK